MRGATDKLLLRRKFMLASGAVWVFGHGVEFATSFELIAIRYLQKTSGFDTQTAAEFEA